MLFTSTPPVYTKIAASRLLSNNPSSWHSELLAQLFEQHSYLGAYKVDLSVSGQNDEMGYIHGYFIIGQQTYPDQGQGQNTGMVVAQPVAQPNAQAQQPQQQPQQQPMQQPQQASAPGVMQQSAAPSGPSVRIPVIAAKRKVFALDIMIDADGAFQPLTEARVAGLLKQPALAEVTEAPTDDQTGFSQFDVPGGSSGSRGGSYGSRGGTYEKSSHLLQRIAPSISDKTKEAFFDALDTPEYRWALSNCAPFRDAVGSLFRAKTASAEDVGGPQPTAIVVEKAATGFNVYSANEYGYKPKVAFIPKNEANQLPSDVVQEVLSVGVAVINSPVPHIPDDTEFEVAKTAGTYAALRGNEVIDYSVIPEVYSLDGARLSQVLAVGPGTHALQEKVAGVRLGDSELDICDPGGFGSFVSRDGNRATSPLTVIGVDSSAAGSGKSDGLFIKTASNRQARLVKMAGIRIPQHMGDSTYAIPSSWGFQPLGPQSCVESEPQIVKTASSVQDFLREINLLDEGSGQVSVRGEPVGQLPSEYRERVKLAEAALLLGCLGMDGESIVEKLAECKRTGESKAYAGRPVVSLAAREAVAKDKVAAFVRRNPVRAVDLLKEASLLADEDSVDTVLALGFLTAENVQHFVDKLPELEQACRSMAEMTIMARMGQKDIPEGAASRAMTGLGKTIEGLKVLQLSLQTPEEISQQ